MVAQYESPLARNVETPGTGVPPVPVMARKDYFTVSFVGKDRGIEDEQDHDEADGQGGEAETPPERHDHRWWSGYQMFFQFPPLKQFPVFARPVELEFLQRLALGKHHRINGKSLRPEVRVEEVHGKNKSHGQQRLVTVDDGGHVDQRARHEVREEFREPEEQTGAANDRHAPVAAWQSVRDVSAALCDGREVPRSIHGK